MQALRYLLLFPIVLVGSLFCILFAEVICLFINDKGYLPWWLKWFEPVDTDSGCLDTLWAERPDHAEWSLYKLCYTFIRRNPFYGGCYNPFGLKGYDTITLGNRFISDTEGIAGAYLILASNGVFQFKAVWHIGTTAIIHEAGWQIHDPLHLTFGSYQLAPLRFYKYGNSI
jgi:hypothetical protein